MGIIPSMETIKTMKPLDDTTQTIIKILAERKETITFAESCTGGRIAAEFTAVPGASAVLGGAVVTYSNAIKHQWLGVRQETLDRFGAVSSECITEMLAGVIRMAEADYAIAVSGIAGPTGGTAQKPVGTVFIGIQTPEDLYVYHNLFNGNRHAVQEQSLIFAIEKLAEKIKKM